MPITKSRKRGLGAGRRLGTTGRPPTAGATGLRRTVATGRPSRPGTPGRQLTEAQRKQRSAAGKASAARRRGNRAYRKFAAGKGGSRQDRVAAGALGKAAGKRTAAEKRAVRATAATRAVLKGVAQRTKREQRSLGRARSQYAATVNRMGDRARYKAGRAGKIARPKGYYLHEDYSMTRGFNGVSPGARRPAKFGVRQVSALSRRPRRRKRS